MKHSLIDLSKPLELAKGEQATIIIRSPEVSNADDNPDSEFGAYIPYPSDLGMPIALKAKQDYLYEVELYLTRGEELIGGYSAKWNVKWEVLKDANQIVFHVIEAGATDESKAEFLKNMEDLSKKVPYPELVNIEEII